MEVVNKFLKNTALRFIGDEEEFSLENIIFNMFSFFVCLGCFASMFLNVLVGLYESAIISTFVLLLQSFLLYTSRVKKRFKLVTIITGIELHIVLAFNYFVNGGIDGPTTILFLVVLFLMTSIVANNKAWIWVLVNLVIVGVLFTLEYHFPQAILIGYQNSFSKFFDIYFSYFVVIVLLTTAVLYKRKTYNKQREIAEERAVYLEKLNSEKNKLFSIISHDLRAPLGSVRQYLDYLKENDLTEDERLVIEDSLVKTTKETSDMLDNLLIWAKSQLGGSKVVLADLSVKESLEAVINQIKQEAKIKDIIIVDRICDVKVLADKNMLQLIIRNLLYNALKFSNLKSQVIFEVDTQNQKVIFKIKDSGVGISDADKSSIFSLNVKSSVGTNKERGTGLGLLLCKEYTDLQNGKIWFESEVKVGTTFYLELPQAKEALT